MQYASSAEITATHWKYVEMSEWVWPNFVPQELASKGDGSVRLNIHALNALQKLRQRLGKPLIIFSAYRDPLHNRRVGGALRSQHVRGRAFDLSLSGHDRYKLLILAKSAGFTGFGFYRTFLHVDTGPSRSWWGAGAKDLWS